MSSRNTEYLRWLPVRLGHEKLIYLLLFILGLGTNALIGWNINRTVHFHDEHSQLISAQAIAQGRLTTPTPDKWEFFEIQHVLLKPTYASKYQPGRILFMALGIALLGMPHFGVWLLQGLLYPSICWFLRGIVPMRWALFGSLLALTTVGLFNYWAQTFFGGTLSCIGGALVFGAAWRMLRDPKWSSSVLMGLGVVALMYSRPFEGLLSSLVPACMVAYALIKDQRWMKLFIAAKIVAPASIIILSAFAFQYYYNQAVTGDGKVFPYMAYEEQYSPISSNFFWAEVEPKEYHNPYVERFYNEYVVPRLDPNLSLWNVYAHRMHMAIDFYLGPFFLLLAILSVWRPNRVVLLALLSFVIVMTGTFYNVSFQKHYFAPVYPLVLLLVVACSRRCWLTLGFLPQANWLRVLLVLILILGMAERISVCASRNTFLFLPEDNFVGLNNLRREIELHLKEPSLVFIHYTPKASILLSFGYNTADIDEQQIIYAADLGPEKNQELIEHYQDRVPFLLIIDESRHRMTPYNLKAIRATFQELSDDNHIPEPSPIH